jgi:ribosomal peptide maturation radical SAM protein 1
MPRNYLRTLLPEVASSDRDWMFFYEVKANMRRHELETLAAAGVRWIQPGIESLDSDLLHLMRKGVAPSQNVLLLKWCQELGIFCGWNLLYGLPGETAASYVRMQAIIPKLAHLQPPSGGGRFQLHRFSPYFDHPENYGIRWSGAHHMFRYAFPVADADLNDLVYLHEFAAEADADVRAATSRVEAAVSRWRQAYRDGAALFLEACDDGGSTIVDERDPARPSREYELSAAETLLYLFLDAGVARKALARDFAAAHEEAFNDLGGVDSMLTTVHDWERDDLVLTVDGRIIGLALQTARMEGNARWHARRRVQDRRNAAGIARV